MNQYKFNPNKTESENLQELTNNFNSPDSKIFSVNTNGVSLTDPDIQAYETPNGEFNQEGFNNLLTDQAFHSFLGNLVKDIDNNNDTTNNLHELTKIARDHCGNPSE
jgi:hypothetical protein